MKTLSGHKVRHSNMPATVNLFMFFCEGCPLPPQLVLKQNLQNWAQGDDAGSLVAPTRGKGRQGGKMMGVRRVLLRLREWPLLQLEASLVSLCWTKPTFKLGLMA